MYIYRSSYECVSVALWIYLISVQRKWKNNRKRIYRTKHEIKITCYSQKNMIDINFLHWTPILLDSLKQRKKEANLFSAFQTCSTLCLFCEGQKTGRPINYDNAIICCAPDGRGSSYKRRGERHNDAQSLLDILHLPHLFGFLLSRTLT